MLRLLILCVLLTGGISEEVTSEESEASGDLGDDEDEMIEKDVKTRIKEVLPIDENPGTVGTSDKATGNDDDGFTTIVIIAAVSVVALAAVAIAAILLVRRHMQNRQQGVYSVPTEQSQKAPI